MIKKLTITSLTALSLLLVTAQAEGMKCQSGKCGAGMMKQAKQGAKIQKKRKNSPFLIKHGLPHLTKILMKNWDDEKLALTPEQKEKLLVVRKETMGSVMTLKPQIMARITSYNVCYTKLLRFLSIYHIDGALFYMYYVLSLFNYTLIILITIFIV